jgi:hypothetical protein
MGSEVVLTWCQETILAVQAAQGAMGLAGSGGVDLPGSASTLGWRLLGSPRYAVSLRGGSVRSSLPDLRSGSALGRDRGYWLFSGTLTGSLGIFDGFSLAPTVGGVFSVDLSASGHLISAPQGLGFQESPLGWGVGIRLGLVRESFSLPGISVSAYHRRLGDTGLGNVAGGEPSEATFDIRVSSLRGMAGKDLWGVGVLAGVGWDRSRGDAVVRVPDPGAELPQGTEVSVVSFDEPSTRSLLFLGASRTFLTLQISGEIGWAEGFDNAFPERGASGRFDPGSGSYFGSLALRLTL